MVNIRKLEADLWESADLLRAESKLTSNQYCMPVLGLIFLRYAYSRFKMVEKEIMANRPSRNGQVMPVSVMDFKGKSALYLPKEAQFDYLVNLPPNVADLGIKSMKGDAMNSLGEVVNNAMELVESQSKQLEGILPKDYTMFSNSLLSQILRIFNNDALDDIGGDVIGRIYEYFLSKFAKVVASDDDVFFTPKSLVKMIVNVLEPKTGVLLDPACGSGGMFVQTGDFVNAEGVNANRAMTFYGQEKVEYNAKLCRMNMAVHGLSGAIKSGDEANSFYQDAHNLEGKCDYVMANPPFNVDKVKAESASNAGRLPFGLPGFNAKTKEIGNANYLWISYFYAYLNEKGRAGFVMASSATDSSNKDRDIREQLVKTGDVDVMVSVGNNFFYTLTLPCSLWFFDKGKKDNNKDKVLFIDARNYYTVVDRTLNEWSDWQLLNLQAIVHLYRGESDRYKALVDRYISYIKALKTADGENVIVLPDVPEKWFSTSISQATAVYSILKKLTDTPSIEELDAISTSCREYIHLAKLGLKDFLKEMEGLGTKEKKEFLEKYCPDYKTLQQAKKAVQCQMEVAEQRINAFTTVVDEMKWLIDKFGVEGNYRDILGLCKIATTEEIGARNYSLTPGAYVGVAEVESDGVDFQSRMNEIHSELAQLNAEANTLMQDILKEWEGLK